MKRILVFCAIISLAVCNSPVGNWNLSEDGNLLYIETEHKFNWFQALHECVLKNMSLIAVDSVSKHIEIYNLLKPLYSGAEQPRIWIGGHDNAIARNFEWISTGLSFTFTNWATGEPNDSDDVEHCVAIWSNALGWNDAPCSSRMGFICEENQSLKKTTRELLDVKAELQQLKATLESQSLIDKIQELDDLRKSYEKQTIELQENQNKYDSWKSTYEETANKTLKEKNEELAELKAVSELQSLLLEEKQQELDILKESFDEKLNQKPKESHTAEQNSAHVISEDKENSALMEAANEVFMKQLFTGKSELSNALMKSNDSQKNATITNRFYNFVVHINEN